MTRLSHETVEALIAAVRDAGRTEIMPRFRRLDARSIDTKSGPDDLVTVADRAAEAAITAAVKRILPEAGVIGEEAVAEDAHVLDQLKTRETCVVIDPIDGTANYASGLANFGVILAVVDRGRTILGLLYDPVMEDWVIAQKGTGAWFCRDNDAPQRLHVSPERPISESAGFLPLFQFAPDLRQRLAATLPGFGRTNSLRCSCHEYRMLAMGHADFCISEGSNPWDHAAGALIVEEAGGSSGTLDGADHEIASLRTRLITANAHQTVAAIRDTLTKALA